MRCSKCQFENRPGVTFCEQCGTRLMEDIQEDQTCPSCGFSNRPGVNFCEECGEHLTKAVIAIRVCPSCDFTNREGVKFCEQCGISLETQKEASISENKSRKKPKRKKSELLKWVVRVGIVLLLILLGLILLGLIPSKNEMAPVVRAEPIPLLMLQGLPAADTVMVVQPGGFSATATDPEGIERMELYVDGELTDAENYPGEPNTPVVFEPPLEALPEGEHEIMVVVTNSDGKTEQSQVVPVINDEPVPLPPEEGFVIEPDPYNLPAPEVITAMLSADGKTVKAGWSLPDQPFKETNIYLQSPGAAGMTLQAVAGSTVTEYDFPADPAGLWYIYVSYVFLDGREGPLGKVHIVVPDPEADDAVISSKSLISSANVSLDMTSSNLSNGIFAYVRVGGDINRFQRIPEGQGEVLYRQATGSLFNFQIPFNNWPISQPLMVEVELWALNEDQTPYRVGWYTHTFTTEDMAQGQLEFNSNEFTAQIDLEVEEKFGVLVTDTAGGPRPELLPLPTNIHLATTTAQCQNVTSSLGKLRDALYGQCVGLVMLDYRHFLLWDWPPDNGLGLKAKERDISGFELKAVVSDDEDQLIGEMLIPIPYPEARGFFRSTELCGYNQVYYIRAVGTEAVSEWVYAGRSTCTPWEPEANGCGGQSDFVPDLIPDLMFEPACDTHDKCYNREWSGENKVKCDNEFLWDMLAICSDTFPMIDPATCSSLAYTYYEAVNLFGRFFYEGDMDVRDCLKAVNQADCLLGHSPEFLSNAWNGIKSGANYSWQAAKTGWGKVGDAGGWVGGKLGGGLSRIGSIFD